MLAAFFLVSLFLRSVFEFFVVLLAMVEGQIFDADGGEINITTVPMRMEGGIAVYAHDTSSKLTALAAPPSYRTSGSTGKREKEGQLDRVPMGEQHVPAGTFDLSWTTRFYGWACADYGIR